MRGAGLVLLMALLGACGGDDRGTTPGDTMDDGGADAASATDAMTDVAGPTGLFNLLRISVVPRPPSTLRLVGLAGAARIAPGTMTVTVGSADPVTTEVASAGSFTVDVEANVRAAIHIEIVGSRTDSGDFIIKNGKLAEKPE